MGRVNVSDEALELAAEAFFASMRREFIKKYPNEPCQVRAFRDYSRPDQLRFLRSMRAAFNAASQENVERVRSARGVS